MYKSIALKYLDLMTFLCIFLASLLLLWHLGMDYCWDTLAYHYFNGWATVHFEGYRYGALGGLQTFLNPLADAMNYLTFNISAYWGGVYLACIFAGIIFLVYKINLKLFAQYTFIYQQGLAWLATLISCSSVNAIFKFGSFSNEHIVALFFLLSLYLSFYILQEKSSKTFLFIFLSGFFAGISLGIKLSSLGYIIALWAGLIYVTFPKIKPILPWTLSLLLGYLMIEGPFLLLRWIAFDNPIFPFANNIFHSPNYFLALTPPSVHKFSWAYLGLYLTLPIKWIYSSPFSEVHNLTDGRLLLGFIGFFICAGKQLIMQDKILLFTKREIKLILIVFLLGWISWIFLFRIYRFLLILELLSGTIFIASLVEIKLLTESKKFQNLIVSVLIFLFLIQVSHYPIKNRLPWTHKFLTIKYPFKVNKNQIVFLAGSPLSFLAPNLISHQITVANLFTQPWSNIKTKKFLLDPYPVKIPNNPKNIFIIQYGKNIPDKVDKYFSSWLEGHEYFCKPLISSQTKKPFMCTFR